MSETEPASGGRVVGRYVLYDEVASGGMASVHIGRLVGAVGFTRPVAIKRLHPQFARDAEFTTMFLDEARLAARIRHPNVVSVLDVEKTDDELFLVMEFIHGETLSRLTRLSKHKTRVVPLPIALTLATDILYGLDAAHEAKDEQGNPLGIVHRDVSPHNVIIGTDGIARVLDFGIAKASSNSQTTRDGQVKGKFAYMSPEQLSRGKVDRRADVFAAATVLWEMLTGERLFSADDPAGSVARVLTDEIEPPSKYAMDLPPGLDAVVLKGLERSVADRFASAAEMARAIEALGSPLARPAEVGAWVSLLAGEQLRQRSKRLTQIESTGSHSGRAAVEAAAALSGPKLPPSRDATGSSSGLRPRIESVDVIEIQDLRAPSRRRWIIAGVAAVAAIFGAGVVVAWRLGEMRATRAPTPVAASVAPPVTVTVTVTAPPPPPPSTVATASATAPPTATHRPHVPVAVPVKPRVDCSTPFYLDKSGIKHFKPECIGL
jgi:serine/threonine protein kinase